MTDIPALNEWLLKAGYKYHAFISWPHINDSVVRRCASRLREVLVDRLSDNFYSPNVFIDERSIRPGEAWPSAIRSALCQSVTMIAVWSNMYFDQRHHWCGLEWATMQKLSALRLGGDAAIIPVKAKDIISIPPAASRIHYVDFTNATTRSRYFYTDDFRNKVDKIARQVHSIAETMHRNAAIAGCDTFTYPTASAFPATASVPPPAPFR